MKKSNYFISFIIGIILLILFQFIFIWNLYLHTQNEIGQNAINISKAVANTINIEEYSNLLKTKTRNAYFYKMQNYFRKTATDTAVKYLYVSIYISDKEIEYIFDSSQDSFFSKDNNVHPFIYKTKKSTIEKLTNYKKWGTLLTGNTPLIDKTGKLIGVVGVDIDLSNFNSLLFLNEKPSYIYSFAVLLILILMMYLHIRTNYKQKAELIKFYKKSFNMLTESLSQKSDYTSKHSEKVSFYAEIIAKNMGLKDNEIKTIAWAALLHDIGKMGISDKILNKPGKLTTEEYSEIKKHTIYSRDILAPIFEDSRTFLCIKEYTTIMDIVSYHHERWDGKGYPFNLKETEIPLTARIVGFADSLEAMLAERPYKKSLEKNQVIAEIKNNSGKQFDPRIVAVFFDCLEKGLIDL